MAVTRWTLYDSLIPETAVFSLNPLTGGERTKGKTVAFGQFTTVGPVMVLAQDPLQTGTFTGYILSKTDWNFFQHWFNKDNPLVLTDDLGGQTTLVWQDFNPQRQRKSENQWFAKYTATFTILSATDF